ncbi:MAG TPA: two-component sensor histidine kinase [Devosia sp.]|nr:two-component sensor histidine kinase [Devosia sp.]
MSVAQKKPHLTKAKLGVLQSLQQPVLVCGQDKSILWVNAAAEIFFGVSQSLMSRQRLEDYFKPDSPLLGLVHRASAFHLPMTEYRMNVSLPRRTAERTCDVYVSPLGEAPGLVSVLFQERTMAEKIDRQLVSRGAARSVTGLAAMLAHEIKNPLSGIRGAAQLLEQTVSPDEAQLAGLIREETDRIVKLVDRIEVLGDARPLQREPVNIHVVLDRVKLLAANGVARDIKILEAYDPSLPPVWGNTDQLIQTFLNLVKNAAEALENMREPAIRISTAFRPGIKIAFGGSAERVSLPLEIIVSDNGPGVPTEILPFLFDPFVTTKASGSGLGLALVAKTISDHGGVIECESEPGNTSFRVLLPVSATDKSAISENQ